MFNRPPLRKSVLGVWIAEHMPQLDAELGPMPLGAIRERLNELTGLSIQGSAPVKESIDQFLVALKQIHTKGPACSANT